MQQHLICKFNFSEHFDIYIILQHGLIVLPSIWKPNSIFSFGSVRCSNVFLLGLCKECAICFSITFTNLPLKFVLKSEDFWKDHHDERLEHNKIQIVVKKLNKGRKRKSFRIFDRQIFFWGKIDYTLREDLKLENRLKGLAWPTKFYILWSHPNLFKDFLVAINKDLLLVE